MNNYNWTISALDCKVNENGLSNVIESIHWRYGNQMVDTYGVISLPAPSPESFTDFDSITKEMVITWLDSIFSKKNPIETTDENAEVVYEEFSKLELMQKDLDSRIELQNNPITVTKYL